ncbi:hypothetical protein JW979_11685 [bacterium]|nr:hypothetical protein [candidate division CSSED10-310 bacterium]
MKLSYKIILIFVTLANMLPAEEQAVRVRPYNDEVIEISNIQSVTVLLKVVNEGSEADEFIGDVELPKNWKSITQEFPFILNANQTEIRLVSFFIPRSVKSGEYTITYHVRSRKYPSVSDYYEVKVNVLPVIGVDINLISEPEFVFSGEAYTIKAIITNASNIKQNIDLSTQSNKDLVTQIDNSEIILAAGASEEISVNVITDEKLMYEYKHHVLLKATISGTSKSMAEVTSSVTVIPNKMDRMSLYNKINGNVKISGVYQENSDSKFGYQGNIALEGFIDPNKEKEIKLRLRGPDTYETSILGDYDEYQFSYMSNSLNIYLGDRNFSLTQLTENFRYGRGIEGNYKFNNLLFGGFFHKSRWTWMAKKEVAGYMKYTIFGKNQIGLNYLRKYTRDTENDIYSIKGNISSIDKTDIEIEYAQAKFDGDIKRSYHLNLAGSQKAVRYYFKKIYADNKFPGYYENTDYLYSGFSFALTKKINLSASVRHNKENFDLDTTRYSAPYEKIYNIVLLYRMLGNTDLRVTLWDRNIKDRFDVPKFNYNERTVRFDLSKSYNQISFHGSAELGETRNYLTQMKAGMEKAIGTVRWSPSPRQYIQGFVQYDNNIRYSGQKSEIMTFGFNTSFNVHERTDVRFYYQNNHSIEDYYQDRNLVELSAQHRFVNDHSISFRARKTIIGQLQNRDDTAFLFNYTAPFAVPISKKRNIGVVRGTIHDYITGEPIRDALIRINGSMAATDKEGYFIFPALKPNDYYLTVDKASIGMNRVTVEKTPMKISVSGQSEQEINVQIADGSQICGNVCVYTVVNDSSDHFSSQEMNNHLDEFYVSGSSRDKINRSRSFVTNGKTKLVEAYCLSGIVVEVQCQEEIHRRVTKEDGSFCFDELRPGDWILKCYETNLPEYHQFEPNQQMIHLYSGTKQEFQIKVVPKGRKIRFQQEGGMIIQESIK